jgi:uncharacterized OB-fold protein
MAEERDRPWSEEDGTPAVRGVRCGACGATLFPPQRYGCTACGARGEQLAPVAIPATGTLHAYAMVHRHQSHPTPYLIGEVVLDAGPMVRSLLAPELSPRIGQRVRGVVRDDGQALVFTGAQEDAR